jgi:hypothetical protein
MIAWCRARFLFAIGVAAVWLVAIQQSSASPQGGPPPEVRAMLEGTWQLEEWHVDGQVLRPPQANGRWSLNNGVVIFVLHRADTAESAVGYGEYKMDATTWQYRYTRMQRTAGPLGGPVTVTVSPPEPEMRVFTITQAPGKVTLQSSDSQHEYDRTFFTLQQRGRLIRKWRRISSL